MKTFLDCDNIKCVYVNDVLKKYKKIPITELDCKTWEIDDATVMAYEDMKTFLSENELKKLLLDELKENVDNELLRH